MRPPITMVIGKTYRVQFNQPQENGRTRKMEFVGSFLGTTMFDEYLFNQRPAAGTGSVPYTLMISAEETTDAHSRPVKIN